ncbi:DUF1064 domain-containing protein [Planomicrobium sp. YIM 101495]|uniref:DUF1064 domain-containing protein n=1 Tax=Planomicrobium sp. YIM 101495 TaxID=2665160 RepID=UPI0012B88C73|nr:DUF1064 domain-containing protein [Planomicrobium sp. YIM 101495]MTD30176.1 DUF1064 domain-containing protein [Planomicrobium sp. YIM 101495]
MRNSRPRAKRQARQYISKKAEYDGHEFDSLTEMAYYKYLKQDQAVKDIELQPAFQLVDRYEVECKRCSGTGKLPSARTGNPVNCRLCKGVGRREKPGIGYTADFRVTYIDGFEEVIDIKGGPVSRDFPLRQKLFERRYGKELVVIERKGKEWVRK